jgi:hypothetical protein
MSGDGWVDDQLFKLSKSIPLQLLLPEKKKKKGVKINSCLCCSSLPDYYITKFRA